MGDDFDTSVPAPPCVWPHGSDHLWTSSGPVGEEQPCDHGCGLRFGHFQARVTGSDTSGGTS